MSRYVLSIGGKAAHAPRTFDVVNPFDESVVGQCPEGTVELVDDAVRSAREAFPAWSSAPDHERVAKLMEIAALIERNHAELSRLVTLEQGKPQSGPDGTARISLDANAGRDGSSHRSDVAERSVLRRRRCDSSSEQSR